MNTEQKRYLLVFTGLFLMILGGLLYIKTYKKSAKEIKKNQIRAYIIANKEDKPENIFVPFDRPTKVNFVYDDAPFKRDIPISAGLKEYRNDKYLNNAKIVCNGKNCRRQALVSKNAKVVKIRKAGKSVNVIDGNVLLSKNNLKKLKSNTRINGDLYIKDINFLRIPKDFCVVGNVHVINSQGLTFMGNNFIDGHIFVSGKSSLRAFPKNVKITGQIFM